MLTNTRATMTILQVFFVQGLQPRCVRELKDREKDISSLRDLRKRFEIILARIHTAHVENSTPNRSNNNNNKNLGNNNNNRARDSNSPHPSFVQAHTLVAPALGAYPSRPSLPAGTPPLPSLRYQPFSGCGRCSGECIILSIHVSSTRSGSI